MSNHKLTAKDYYGQTNDDIFYNIFFLFCLTKIGGDLKNIS